MIRRCSAAVPVTSQIGELIDDTIAGATIGTGMDAREVFQVLATGSYSRSGFVR